MSTNITEKHKEQFAAIKEATNICLFSCFVNGEPASAICSVTQDEQTEEYIITPMFVSVTTSMVLTDHDGVKVNDY